MYIPFSPNYFYMQSFKAIHTYVHNTVVPLQYYSPHYTRCPVTTLVQVGETFLLLSVLLLKFWTSSQTAGHVFFVNMLSKIGRSDYFYHGTFIP